VLPQGNGDFELQVLFDTWLVRRLESPGAISPVQLCRWLRDTRVGRGNYSDRLLAALKARFEQRPELLGEVFDLLASTATGEEISFDAYTIWKALPPEVWPIPQSEFFLGRAQREADPDRAASYFRAYLSRFPVEGASLELAEAGFHLVSNRCDLAEVLGGWRSCPIDKWRIEEFEGRQAESRKRSERRARDVADITPLIPTIQDGLEEHVLSIAATVYLGLGDSTNDSGDARERLVSATNDEIADAILRGFARYADSPNIPRKEAIIESWLEGEIPYTHCLLSLSVFIRDCLDMTAPSEALPDCIAAVMTDLDTAWEVQGYQQTLEAWFLQEARQSAAVVASVLGEAWRCSPKKTKHSLPGFRQLSQASGLEGFLASLAAEVLRSGIEDDHAVGRLVSVLLAHDRRAALEIGVNALAADALSPEARLIWSTVLFVVSPGDYAEQWRALIAASDPPVLWHAIEVLKGDPDEQRVSPSLSLVQRVEVVMAVGRRFANVGHPSGWSGDHNPWDASEFVRNQIRLVSADASREAAGQLERLERDGGLASYRELVRHYGAQHEKQHRERSFAFGTPEQVSEAITDRAPATPNDLLALVVSHLGALSYEMARTQREKYHAYWNEKGRNLVSPKREEVCSGLLADDLQHRVQAQGLLVLVEHHMVADKECDLVVLQGTERLLPIEVKHHYNAELWTAWRTQLDLLYARDAKACGLGVYVVLWSGESQLRKVPEPPNGLTHPAGPAELRNILESLIPHRDRHRLRVIVVDISDGGIGAPTYQEAG
jgi:hypothetical protein